jgi:hypothetical protein
MTGPDLAATAVGAGGFSRTVGDRLVVVVIGSRSQTVSICTAAIRRGQYEDRYRLVGRAPLVPEDIEVHRNVGQLRGWLEALGSSVRREDPQAPGRTLPSLIAAPPADNPCLRESITAVETEIDRLVEDFLERPFMHRVEHSVHAQLFSMLGKHDRFRADYAIGDTSQRTQLLHKEWPETAIGENATKRGNFDLVVLEPSQLQAATLDHIRTGSIAAGVVIEMGLNYGLRHLDQDRLKLENSKVIAGYLVHLSRDGRQDGDLEAYVEQHALDPNIKVAYAHSGEDGSRAVKLLNESAIRTV